MALDYLLPVLAFGGACYCGSWLAYKFIYLPLWYAENWQKEQLARRIAHAIAHNVLHWAFDYSHIKVIYDDDGRHEQVQTVRFLTPLGRRVTLASDETGNDHPYSFLQVWDRSTWRLCPVPVASVYLELDLAHLPYDQSIDWLISHREDIEIQAWASLLDSGVKRVELQHAWLQDRHQRRVIFRVVFRERAKSPDIPQHLDYGEMITAWADYERQQHGRNRIEELAHRRFVARLLHHAITTQGGQFPLKKIQAAFADELSHRQIEAIGQELEQLGILEPTSGPKPRKINLERAQALIEDQTSQLSLDSSPLQIEGQQPG
ncbi:MAG: hypothetical protein DPW09_07970 [Anaerolineae bacterium]|nr:hypothetical protein [Anaerolineales bacterium]MCQ3973364.1 hypothetical protein [Anaerolineae bacterium]